MNFTKIPSLRIKALSILESIFFSKAVYAFKGLEEIKENSRIFGNAAEKGSNILLYAGELYCDYFNDPKFIDNIKSAAANGCKISVVFGPALYIETIDFLKMACAEPNISLYKRPFRDESHFKIIKYHDGKKLAIVDAPHDINVDKKARSSFLLIKGYNDVIDDLERKFFAELDKSEPIDTSNIMDKFGKRSAPEIVKNNETKIEYHGFITREGNDVRLADDEAIHDFETKLKAGCPNSLPKEMSGQ